MRSAIIVAFSLLALSGCADMGIEPFSPYAWDDGNATAMPPAPDEAPPAAPATPADAHFPVVTSVATTPYTAPQAIDLGAIDGDAGTLRLVASPAGLYCDTTTTLDLMAAPAGFKVTRAWTTCSLEADNQTFAAAQGPAGVLPMMSEVPVDEFVWKMAVHRTLVNNTGSHEEILQEVEEPMLAAPGAMWAGDFWLEPICDGDEASEAAYGPMGVHTIHAEAWAHNGRASLTFPVAGLHVLNVTGDGEYDWDNDTVTAVGEWAHMSVASVDITIDFESQGSELYLLNLECNGAFEADWVELPFTVAAEGIAAGWHDGYDGALSGEVFLQRF